MDDYGPVLGIVVGIEGRNMPPDPRMQLLSCLGAAVGSRLQELVLEYSPITVDSNEYKRVRFLVRQMSAQEDAVQDTVS